MKGGPLCRAPWLSAELEPGAPRRSSPSLFPFHVEQRPRSTLVPRGTKPGSAEPMVGSQGAPWDRRGVLGQGKLSPRSGPPFSRVLSFSVPPLGTRWLVGHHVPRGTGAARPALPGRSKQAHSGALTGLGKGPGKMWIKMDGPAVPLPKSTDQMSWLPSSGTSPDPKWASKGPPFGGHMAGMWRA